MTRSSPSLARRVPALGIALALGTVAGLTLAAGRTLAEAPPVTGRIDAYLVTRADDGSERLRAAEVAEPGETMEFRIEFTNAGEEPASGITVVNPVPANTRFLPDTDGADVAARFEVSVDGGESFEPEPVTRIETQPDGSQAEVVIPPEQYTHVRWVPAEPLGAGGGAQRFHYRVAVN